MSLKHQIDNLIDAFDRKPTALYMNREHRRELRQELRALVETSRARGESGARVRSSVGQQIESYRDIPIHIVDGIENPYAVRL
jgi:hypothetical protein